MLAEVVDSYGFPKEIATPMPELIGLSDQQPTKGIMTIEQMADFVETHESDKLFKLHGKHGRHPVIKDIELQIIDSMLEGVIFFAKNPPIFFYSSSSSKYSPYSSSNRSFQSYCPPDNTSIIIPDGIAISIASNGRYPSTVPFLSLPGERSYIQFFSIIQIRIDVLLRTARAAGFASRCRRNHFVKQPAKDRAVMGTFIGDNRTPCTVR